MKLLMSITTINAEMTSPQLLSATDLANKLSETHISSKETIDLLKLILDIKYINDINNILDGFQLISEAMIDLQLNDDRIKALQKFKIEQIFQYCEKYCCPDICPGFHIFCPDTVPTFIFLSRHRPGF